MQNRRENALKVLDLFAGAGGMSLGLHWAGFQSVCAIDHNPVAVETLEVNLSHHGTRSFLRDLSKYTPKDLRKDIGATAFSDIDVVVGGPPCQGWSRVGRAKLRSLKTSTGIAGEDHDPRNELYKSYLRFVDEIRPKAAIMENVPGMLSYRGANMADVIARDFADLGYVVNYGILDAKDYGVPQQRRRLFFVAVRSDVKKTFEFPVTMTASGKLIHPVVTIKEAMGDLPVIQNGAREWIIPYKPRGRLSEFARRMRDGADPETVFDHVCRQQNEQDVEAFRLMKQGGKYVDLPKRLKRYRDDIFDDKYRKLRWNQPSWCVTAHLSKDCYSHIHPSQARTISVREAARIQSFPDSWYFGGNMGEKFQMIGNAVAPLVAEKIGQALMAQVFVPATRSARRNSTQSKASRKPLYANA